MKLQEYFQSTKQHTLSSHEMLDIYEKFLTKKHKKQIRSQKAFLHAKSFMYALSVVVLFLGIYGVYFFNGNISFNEQGLFINNYPEGTTIQADFVASIREFYGSFSLEHEGKFYQSSNIGDGDTVILQKGTKMIFDINSGAKATLVWPAKFVMRKIADDKGNKKYSLVLSYGNFVEMKSLNKDASTMEIFVDNLKIKSSVKGMNFQMQKKEDRYDIKNQWSELFVVQGDNKQISLKQKQALSIEKNNIVVFDNIKDFGQALTYKNVSQTFLLSDDAPVSSGQDILALVTDTISQSSSEEISSDQQALIAAQLGIEEDKELLSTDQLSQIELLISKKALSDYLANTYKWYLLWDNSSFDRAFAPLNSTIQKISAIFGIKYTSPIWTATQKLNSLSNQIDSLLVNIQPYHLPDEYIKNIDVLGNWANYIAKLSYASEKESAAVDLAWTELKSKLPANLLFK